MYAFLPFTSLRLGRKVVIALHLYFALVLSGSNIYSTYEMQRSAVQLRVEAGELSFAAEFDGSTAEGAASLVGSGAGGMLEAAHIRK